MSERAPRIRYTGNKFMKGTPSDTITDGRTAPMDKERFLNEVVNHLRAVGQATLREIHDAIDIDVLRTPANLRTLLRERGPALGIVVQGSVQRRADLTKQNVYGLIPLDQSADAEEDGEATPAVL